MMVFVALKVPGFCGFGWVFMVSSSLVLVSFSRLKCKMPSLSMVAYDIMTGGLMVSLKV